MECKVTTLYVGQGGMNLIEIYDDAKRLVNLSLVDCGGDSKESEASIQYVQEKMEQRMEASPSQEQAVFLDNLIITHRDRDHINLFSKIFNPVIRQDGIFNINGDVWYSSTDENNIYIYQEKPGLIFPDSVTYRQYIRHFEEDHFIFARSNFFKHGEKLTHSVSIDCTLEEGCTIVFNWSEAWSNIHCSVEGKSSTILSCFYDFMNKIKRCCVAGESIENLLYTFDDFKQLYADLIQEILENFFSVPRKVTVSICDVMDKISLSIDDIKSVFEGKKMIPGVWVGSAFIGGNTDQQTKEYKMLRSHLVLHCPNHDAAEFEHITTDQSIFLCEGYKLYVLNRLELEKMAGNSSSEKNNGTSLILVLVEEENEEFQKVVFPGDANVHSFAEWITKCEQQFPLFAYADWLAPHHGSDSYKIQDEQNEGCVFYQILQGSGARKMIISAGRNNHYAHPYFSFMELMRTHYDNTKETVEKHHIWYNQLNCRQKDFVDCDTCYPVYTLCTAVPGEYGKEQNLQSGRSTPLQNSRVCGKTQSGPQKIPAPGLFFRRG